MEGTGCESMWIPPFSSVSSEENDVARLGEELREALAPYLARCASFATMCKGAVVRIS